MNYKVDYDALHEMYTSLQTQSEEWQIEINNLVDRITALQQSEKMSGSAADSIREYLSQVHLKTLNSLNYLVRLHISNCLIYKTDYLRNLDSNAHTVIVSKELDDYKRDLQKQKMRTYEVNQEVNRIVRQINDIVSIKRADMSDLEIGYERIASFINVIDARVESIENKHLSNDFVNTDQLIRCLKNFIIQQLNHDKEYIYNFDPSSLYNLQYIQLLYADLSVNKELAEKQDEIKIAIKTESERVSDIQDEIAEREKKAIAIKAAVIVGCAVITVATAGAGSIAMAAVIGAATGATTAVTDNLTDQYVEHGNLIENYEDIDVTSVVIDGTIGAITGSVSGAMGTWVSGSITKVIGPATTTTGKYVISGISTITGNGVERGVEAYLETGDSGEAFKSAFNPKNIFLDSSLGILDVNNGNLSSVLDVVSSSEEEIVDI